MGVLGIFLAFIIIMTGCGKPIETLVHWQEKYGYKPDQVYSMDVDENGLPHVKVAVNDSILDMILDTGNMHGMSIELDKARQLRLARIDSWDGEDYRRGPIGKYSIFHAVSIDVFKREWKNQRIYESSFDEYDGSIGPMYISKERFTLDYKNKLIGVGYSQGPVNDKNVSVLPIVDNLTYKRMIVVKGKVNGHEVLIQIDTGRTRTTIDPKLVNKLKLSRTNEGYIIDSILLGDYDFSVPNAKEADLSELDKDYSEPVLLCIGSDVISRMVLTIDYYTGQVIINK